ncbi:MAG: FAD-dependent oxidoreductase [Planctomycetia bacterium]|nr:FAD-dependent oxidoreductase [Planctomycetia bacterium]
MAIRISNLRTPIDEPETALGERLRTLAGNCGHRILRKALDARDSHRLEFVYTLELKGDDDDALFARLSRRSAIKVDHYTEEMFAPPSPGSHPLEHRPIVIGSGPGGLAAACFLAEQGYAPLVLERGRPVSQRIRDVAAFDAGGPHDPESNYLFGEGGAGTFSDGKLTYRSSGPDVRYILELFAACKGKPSIVYEARPHLGSNRLPAVVKAMRQRIEAHGGEVRFNCRVEDLDIKDGTICGVMTSSGFIPATVVLLAIGHSARDTYEMLARRGVKLEQKPFQFGVRIEQPQETVNRVCYGEARLEDQLGAASYSLVANGQHDLFTFCMCAGGYIMPSVSEPEAFCTNGMSLSKHDSPYANSGLVVTIPPEHFGGSDPLAGVRLQQHYERIAYQLGGRSYRCPTQSAQDYLSGRVSAITPKTSYPREMVSVELRQVLPPLVADAVADGLPIMDRRWNGRFLREATLVGPEARGSAPIRIVRDEWRMSPGIVGLYPVGEGAGYAGGIISAAVDGLRSAVAVMARHALTGR